MSTFIAPFLLISRSGETVQFDSLDALDDYARAAHIVVERYHVREHTDHKGVVTPVFHDWIVRDDHGQIMVAADWGGDYCSRRLRRLWWNTERDDLIRHAERLGLPIPFTGARVRGYRQILRHPRQHGVWRAEAASRCLDEDDLGIGPIRGRIKRPPTIYDDLVRQDYGHHCWKRHRRHQHKD